MELILRQGEREVRATVERAADGTFAVVLGERRYRIDVARPAAALRSLLIEGRQYEVGLREESAGRYQVSAGGGLYNVEAVDPLTFLARQSHGDKGSRGSRSVSAYMPGRVVALLVAPGDQVVAGQGLLVLEAMKMQNEIQAERAGRVKAILVEPGEAVDSGDPLIELE